MNDVTRQLRQHLRNEVFLQMAIELSKLSTCHRRQVGCILVDHNNKIIGSGYNGVHAGARHCTNGLNSSKCLGADAASGSELGACGAIHAEQNALMQCTDVTKIHTAYVTTFPCIHCVKMLLNTNCEIIVYGSDYAHVEAKDLWWNNERISTKL